MLESTGEMTRRDKEADSHVKAEISAQSAEIIMMQLRSSCKATDHAVLRTGGYIIPIRSLYATVDF